MFNVRKFIVSMRNDLLSENGWRADKLLVAVWEQVDYRGGGEAFFYF